MSPGGAEAELLGAQQRGHHHVATRLETAIGTQRHAVTQVVAHEDLVDLGEAELPRDAHVLDGRQRAGARATDMAADLDVVRARLGDARRDGADAQGRDELDADARTGIDGPQVGDELRQVLDGVDVVMWRRADERDAGLRPSQTRDERCDLLRRQLTTLARLGALGDLDLQLLGAREVLRRDPEPGRGDLLDGGVAADAIDIVIPGRVLATLAAVGRHAQASQADGEGLMCLRAQGTQAHGRAHETAQDGRRALDLGQVARLGRMDQVQLVTDRGGVAMQRGPVFGDRLIVVVPTSREVLDGLDDGRCVQVALAVGAVARPARVGQLDTRGLDGGAR